MAAEIAASFCCLTRVGFVYAFFTLSPPVACPNAGVPLNSSRGSAGQELAPDVAARKFVKIIAPRADVVGTRLSRQQDGLSEGHFVLLVTAVTAASFCSLTSVGLV